MPELRRLYRRVTESHLPTRMIAHIAVVSLVAVASAAGIAQAQSTGSTSPHAGIETGFPSIVTSVRGAGNETVLSSPSIHSLSAHPADDLPLVDRGAPAAVPTTEAAPTAPLPTPVPLDPDATPFAVASNVGGTASASGPSTRAAAPAAVGGLVWPVPGGSYSQYFHSGHLAVDIAAPHGSQIVAAQAGVVTSAGWRNNGGGIVISIDHGNGMVTLYNHLSASWVSAGQYVAAGQGIGAIGCTGMCTGPHVHFQVIVNGVIDNPQRYF